MKTKKPPLRVSKDKLPECFCPVPFASVILNPDGVVGSCREKGTKHFLGNVKDNSIEEIWNGDKFREWRREFLTGNIKTCLDEIRHSSCNKLNYNQDLMELIDPCEVVDTPIIRLSPDINGRCNLQCPFCDVWKMPNGLYDGIEGFWEHMQEHILPYVVQIDPLAGEPFIQKDLYKMIEMSAKVNSKCEWRFTTNGQWELTDKIKSYLDMININCISMSMDSVVEETYEKIRYPGKLDKPMKNLFDLIEYSKTHKSKFDVFPNFSIQRENVYEMKKMIDFCDKNNFLCFIHYVYLPSELSPSKLPKEEIKKILRFYFNSLSIEELVTCHRPIRALIDTFPDDEKKQYYAALNSITGGQFSKLTQNDQGV